MRGKMGMKRVFALILMLAIVLTLTACYEEPVSNVDQYAVTLPADFVVEVEKDNTLPTKIKFDKQTVCEGDDYDIIINGIIPNAPEGYILTVSFSNNTEARQTVKTEYIYETDEDGEKQIVGEQEVVKYDGLTYLFTVDSAIVNGKKIDVSFSTSVDAEDKAFDQIVLGKDAIESLDAITEIELFFKVFVSREEDVLISDFSIMVYPYGNLDEEI